MTTKPIKFPTNESGVLITVSKVYDALLFKLPAGTMSLDLDGNPHTYGIKDQGIDDICNGLSALDPPKCAGQVPHGQCYSACQRAIRLWDGTPNGAKRLFCSIGLGSGSGSTFLAPLQEAPNQAYFVSETSTKYVAPPGAPTNWAETQAAQLDPISIPYFVLPPALRKQPFDASPGDVGVMIRTDHLRPPVFFIVGDSGNNNKIGEASARIFQLLSISGILPIEAATSAFGQTVNRTRTDESPEVIIAIFRHSTNCPVGDGNSINLTPNTIIAWITNTGNDRLRKLGGADSLLHCYLK